MSSNRRSENEQMASDLYDNLFKAMDYPLSGETLLVDRKQCSDPTDFMCHLAEEHEQWEQQDPLGQYAELLDSVTLIEPDWAVVRGNHALHTLDAPTARRWRT